MSSESIAKQQKSNAIELNGLTKKFKDVTAVNGIDLSIGKGELFGLLGPNGAGKSTTINILCGLVSPTSGKALVGGYDTACESISVKEIIGVCPQETAFFPYLTGRENLEFFGGLYDVPSNELKKRVDTLLDKMALSEDAKRRTKEYSGGMKRRISLAIAFVSEPKIVFLDEPTVGMDPQSRRAVWDFINEQKASGKTIVLTTHYMEECELLCDRVGIIDHGKVIALGKPAELIKEHGATDLEDVFIRLTGRNIREAI